MVRMRRLRRLVVLLVGIAVLAAGAVSAVAFWPSAGSAFSRSDVEGLSHARVAGWASSSREYRAIDCSDMRLRDNDIWVINCRGEQWERQVNSRGQYGDWARGDRFWFILLFDDNTGRFIDSSP